MSDDNIYAQAANRQQIERRKQEEARQNKATEERLKLEAVYAAGEAWWKEKMIPEIELAQKGIPNTNFKIEHETRAHKVGPFKVGLVVNSNYPLVFNIEGDAVKVYRDTRTNRIVAGTAGSVHEVAQFAGRTDDEGSARRILIPPYGGSNPPAPATQSSAPV